MKRLIFVLSLLSVVAMSVDTADANGRRLGRRFGRRCCVVKPCCVVQPCCVAQTYCVTPSPTVCYQPAASTCTGHAAHVHTAPVTSYKPASSGCQECDAAAQGSFPTGQSVVEGIPQPAAEMAQGQGNEMSHGQVLARINAYLDRVNGNICGLKSQFPEYGSIINSLSLGEKMRVGGTTICYPSLEVWNTRPDIRADAIRVLTENGVI